MSFIFKYIAAILALIISIITTFFLFLVPSVDRIDLIIIFCFIFSVSFPLIYFVIEVLIFKQIRKIYQELKSLKKKDSKFPLDKSKTPHLFTPLRKLQEVIFNYITKKQAEIDQLKELENYRREFLADISHELKTPIFAAQGFIHTLIDGAVNDIDVRDKFLQKAANSLDGLDALVKDILTLSQMEIGAVQMHFQEVNLATIVQEIFEQLEHKAQKKHIQLIFSQDLEKTITVLADPQRIRQVMSNLISNAIKYGKENGHVTVELVLDKAKYLINVKDDGPGIPPEHQDRIFERFYRVEKSRSKDGGGTGLGLAIAKQIIEAHHSKIQLYSIPDQETIFSFKLAKYIA